MIPRFCSSFIRYAVYLGLLSFVLIGCMAGNPQFTVETPSGFWVGLWHGLISWLALLISIFSEQVRVYEPHNTGGWYDFGFLLGIACISGGSSHTYHCKVRAKNARNRQEWEKIGLKVEEKLKQRILE